MLTGAGIHLFAAVSFLSVINTHSPVLAQSTGREKFSDALVADSCRGESADDQRLFEQFVGSWEFDWTGYNPDGTKEVVKGGEWIFSWILEGRAIQDVWILPGRNDRYKPGALEGEYGTTIRYYDRAIKKWRVFWLGPVRNAIKTFLAEKVGTEIVLTQTPAQDKLRNWILSDITRTSFRWREEVSDDNGATWRLTQDFLNRRIGQ